MMYVGLGLLVVLVAVAVAVLKPKSGVPAAPAKAALPYRKRDYLLTKAERSFYLVLLQTVGDRYRVFAKVRLLDLLWLPRGTANPQSFRNRVQSKHVDFVLCTPDDLAPAVVIELDDASHESPERVERDSFVDQALAAAGLPILHLSAKRGYVTDELAERIAAATSEPASAQPISAS